jgi:hypothetical protein
MSLMPGPNGEQSPRARHASAFGAGIRVAAQGLLWIVIFILELAACVVFLVPIRTAAEGGWKSITAGPVRVTGSRNSGPQLVFSCCDAPSERNASQSPLSNPQVIADLQQIHAGVAVPVDKLDAGYASLVHQLNEAGIPATAWFVVPGRQGYYLNASNATEAEAHFAGFQKWTAQYGLRWSGIALDMEPSLQEFAILGQEPWWNLLPAVIRNSLDAAQVAEARRSYARLIRNMQAYGYFVETVQMPFIATERAAHTTLLERLMGLVNVKGNVEVLMLYSSFNRSIGPAMIWVFGPEAQAISVGVTGALNWREFSTDMILASHFGNLIGVYNLEGCIGQGFLPRIKTIAWNQTVTIPAAQVRRAILLHALFPAALWTVSRLPYIAAIVLLIDISFVWARRRKRAAQCGT